MKYLPEHALHSCDTHTQTQAQPCVCSYITWIYECGVQTKLKYFSSLSLRLKSKSCDPSPHPTPLLIRYLLILIPFRYQSSVCFNIIIIIIVVFIWGLSKLLSTGKYDIRQTSEVQVAVAKLRAGTPFNFSANLVDTRISWMVNYTAAASV